MTLPPFRHYKPEELRQLLDQTKEAEAECRVTCECGHVLHLSKVFRCLYCGIWFCQACAEKHFGKTREEWGLEKDIEKQEKEDDNAEVLEMNYCGASFELANGEIVTPCHLPEGHQGDHEGTVLGSTCRWPQGVQSEEELHKMDLSDTCLICHQPKEECDGYCDCPD